MRQLSKYRTGLWTRKRHTIARPWGWAMECFFLVFCTKFTMLQGGVIIPWSFNPAYLSAVLLVYHSLTLDLFVEIMGALCPCNVWIILKECGEFIIAVNLKFWNSVITLTTYSSIIANFFASQLFLPFGLSSKNFDDSRSENLIKLCTDVSHAYHWSVHLYGNSSFLRRCGINLKSIIFKLIVSIYWALSMQLVFVKF